MSSPSVLAKALSVVFPSFVGAVAPTQDPFHAWWSRASAAQGRTLTSISFSDVGVPQGEDVNTFRVTDEANISGTPVFHGSHDRPENAHVLVVVGETWRAANPYEGDTFGLLRTSTGSPIRLYNQTSGEKAAAGFYSVYPDFASMIHKNRETVMIVHMEDYPGGTYRLDIDMDSATGRLKLKRSTFMDWSKYGGMWNPCAGTLSPWNTHLGAEEYGPDARAFEAIDGFPTCTEWHCTHWDPARQWANVMRYYDVYPVVGNWTAYRAEMDRLTSPYFFGYIFEAGLKTNGSSFGVKRMAMGRKSGELAFVMPDRRTAYMTDDGTNTFLSVFVADEEGDLSAGKLFCARVNQTHNDSGGAFTIDWLDMGHATEEDVFAAVFGGATRPVFSDLFEASSPLNSSFPAVCPDTYTAVHGTDGLECLKVRPGQEMLASRIESRRYASYLGCTTEWSKMEGFTYSADSGKAYIAMSEVRKGMEDLMEDGQASDAYDAGTGNHIRLQHNPCGCVYEIDVDASTQMATAMRGMLCGKVESDGACSDPGIANPDNLAAIHGHMALLIGEDSSRRPNNALWRYDLESGTLQERIATTPLGAEVSSPYFYPDVGGFTYVTLIAQHPVAPGFGQSALGYTMWPRHCNTSYPSWAMPGDGAAETCASPSNYTGVDAAWQRSHILRMPQLLIAVASMFWH